MRKQIAGAAVLVALASTPVASAAVTDLSSTIDGARGEQGARTITYVGTIRDEPDLRRAGLGAEGSWFPQFDAPAPVVGAPTGDSALDRLPAWVAAFNHVEAPDPDDPTDPPHPGCTTEVVTRGCLPTYAFRTFSQDGPARSSGGHPGWSSLRLPGGECGAAGAIVDPHTHVAAQDFDDPTGLLAPREGEARPNNNNTINRLQLQDGVPDRFVIGVVTDTTSGAHDGDRVEIRGNVGVVDQNQDIAETQVDMTEPPTPSDLVANGIPDVHLFAVEHFTSGDYLKLRLRGIDAPASFSGLLFDVSPRIRPSSFDPPGDAGPAGHRPGGELAACRR